MNRLEFELETKDTAEKFRETLNIKIPSDLKREEVHYANEKHNIDFFHMTFQDKGIAGTYSYEKTPDGQLYICTLDFRTIQTEINIPAKTNKTETLEFSADKINHLTEKRSEAFQEKGFALYNTIGRHYSTFSFSHQAIAKDGRFAVRYDQEKDGKEYLCHLYIDANAVKEISSLLQDWVQELINKNASEQKK